MTILRDVLAELWGMFLADWRLTAAVLALVALAAVAAAAGAAGLAALVLVAGLPAALVAAVLARVPPPPAD